MPYKKIWINSVNDSCQAVYLWVWNCTSSNLNINTTVQCNTTQAIQPFRHYLHKIILLNLVSAIFYQIFFFSSNDSPSKTIKNVFYFIERALFILDIFNFLRFFPFLSTHFRFKKTNRSGIIYDTNSLADVIFGISQKPLYITSSNLVR